MEKLAAVLEVLAAKLGVATEYLWQALLRQAPIDGVVTLVQYIVIAVSGFYLFRFWKWFNSKDYASEGWAILGGAFTLAWAILAIVGFLCLDTFVSSFINPEYWALHQVLSLIRSK